MNTGLFLLLRRMRLPLVVLILAYAISVLGFVLIPGMDPQGRPWRMDFFHAFYFVSFMGSTIGFGEVPYPFTDAQRLWTTFTIYLTVTAWLYAIGALLATLRDPAFRRVIVDARFRRNVGHITEPFFLVCGYGDTGSLLVRELAARGLRAVVLDSAQERIDALAIEDLGVFVPGVCADAADPDALVAAGLTHPRCAGVLAVARADDVNLKVAITSKLLNPPLRVICRAESHDTEANMESFGTDHVLNPFDIFADRLAMAIHSPSRHAIFEWLTSIRRMPLTEFLTPPRGTWILCGYGRFGKALQRYLDFQGIRTVIVEAEPARTQAPPETVVGRGTEAVTLREAGIRQAAGLVAGTDNDTNNLSIIVTARDLNPNLFLAARQNQRANRAVFQAARLDLIMQPADIIARQILALITTPLLSEFLRLARHHDDDWANALVSRIIGVVGEEAPDTWHLEVDAAHAPALWDALRAGEELRLAHLYTDPRDRARQLPCLALLLKRGEEEVLLPEDSQSLRPGDRILFCGPPDAAAPMAWTASNHNVLDYVRNGTERPSGLLWSWLAGRRQARSES